MEMCEGIVGVVRAAPDSAVLGGRQYVLPNNTTNAVPMATFVPVLPVPVQSVGTEPCSDSRMHAHSLGAQVVDGRYASVYQMAHCNVHPTSPPVQLTEFPPQRAELSRGQGNFEVGGIGSGETNGSPTRTTQSYRGGMNWPDRMVYTPRQTYHYEPDSFAESLRKYPNLSAERSAEIVERLINYTQMKGSCSKNQTRCSVSPTRSEANPACQGLDRRSCPMAYSARTSRTYEPDVNVRNKVPDESPTRDTCKKFDYESIEFKRSLFGRNYDVRYLRDVTRRAKESVRNFSTYPYSHPVCPPIKERYDHLPPKNSLLAEITSINSVHMETQAEISMVSKEVTTLPREQPSMRNVAVPLSPSPSHSNSAKLYDSINIPEPTSQLPQLQPEAKLSHKSIQTADLTDLNIKPRKSVQTCISSIDIAHKKKVKTFRKTKSEEEIRVNVDLEEDLIQMIKNLSLHSDLNTSFYVRNGLLKKLRKIHRTERSDRIKVKLGRCVRDQLCSHVDFKHFTRELSNDLISKIRASNMFLRCYGSTRVLRSDVLSDRKNNDKRVTDLITEWLDYIPLKAFDYLGRPVKRAHVIHTVAAKVNCLIMNKKHHDRCGSLKPELLDILEDIPVDVNSRNKICFFNRISNDLIRRIKDTLAINATDRKRWQKAIDLDKTLRNNLKKECFAYVEIQPSDNELEQFVKQELNDFIAKFHVKICPKTEKEIQIELTDILIDSLNTLRYGQDETIKEEILVMLSDFINISENEGIYFVNNLIYNFKDMLTEIHTDNVLPQTFVVLQNTVHNSSIQTIDYPVEEITPDEMDQNMNSNLNSFTEQILKAINEWMQNIQGLSEVDEEFKIVVAQDLAGDIFDRKKYLELNPSNKRSDEYELDFLKYQIFKWVNKLVGEDNCETIEHVSQLMQRIQNITFPIQKRPAITVLNVDTNIAACCKKDSNPEQRRASSPSENLSPKPKMVYEKRQRSSPYAFSREQIRDEQTKSCATEVNTKNLGVMTDPGQDQIRAERSCCPPPPQFKKTTYTETDMPHIPVTCPQGTSMSMMESPRVERARNRRLSELPALTPTNTGPADQRAVAVNIEQQNTSRPPNADSPRPLCCVVEPKDPSPTLRDLNEDFSQYIKNWVMQIPIITSKPEEQALIDKMRQGLYVGVMKAWTRLHMNPEAMTNRFYFQDVFDDDLEELLDLLPQSSELTRNKQILKDQLIDRTNNMVEQILVLSTLPQSYKQQLMDQLSKSMPRKLLGPSADAEKVHDDFFKLQIAEVFIIYSMYREKDRVKACVFKKKLMNCVGEFFDDLKLQGRKFDFKLFKDDIMNALFSVPQPSDETIREEAKEVLVGFEIAQWFADLPLYDEEEMSEFERINRKRYRNSLAKKVHDLEKVKNLDECEEELRHEITRFMAKLPIKQNELENVPFMVEELINRLKNRPNDVVVGSELRRFMPLIEPNDYDEFSRHMQLCSSFSNAQGTRKAQINESSYFVDGEGNRIEGPIGLIGGQLDRINQNDNFPDSNMKFFNFPENTPPPQAKQMSQGPDSSMKWYTLPECTPLSESMLRELFPEKYANQQSQPLPENSQPIRQPCQQSDPNQQWRTLPEASPQPRQISQQPDSNQPWQTLPGATPQPQLLRRELFPDPNMQCQSLPENTPRPRQTIQQPDSNQQWQTGQGLQPQPQISPDCCQFHQLPRDYKELEDRIQASVTPESRPNTSKHEDVNFTGTLAGQSKSPDRRPPGPAQQSTSYSSRPHEANIFGTSAGQNSSLNQRYLRQNREQSPYTSRFQETHGSHMGQASAPDQRSPGPTVSFPSNRSGLPENMPLGAVPANISQVCPRVQETRGGFAAKSPDHLQIPSYVPDVSSRPYEGARPGTSQRQFTSHQSPGSIAKEAYSTPDQNVPPPRESRPKKRTRPVDTTSKDTARKRLEYSDSDDASEEVRCRCMERIYRCRRKRPIITPCEECDLDFPPCFPMRFPYPYYF